MRPTFADKAIATTVATTVATALWLAATAVAAGTALVTVATNFGPAAEILAAEFGAASGHEITFTAAATTKLAAQIEAGAPFDAFLSADTATPARLAAAGFADAATGFTYATGQLVLWSADPATDLSDPAAALRATPIWPLPTRSSRPTASLPWRLLISCGFMR